MGLAVSLELPLIIVDIQRGGPSTGSADQDRAVRLDARDVRPPRRVADADRRGQDAVGLLLRRDRSGAHRAQVPHAGVVVVATGISPTARSRGACPTSRTCPTSASTSRRNRTMKAADGTPEFWPYLRDEETLARPWAVPGTPGLEHRIGGLEKEDGSGNVNYDGINHERMTRLRAAKIAGIANDIAGVERRRRRRDRPARRRLGFDVRLHRSGGAPDPGPRHEGEPSPPHAPVPVPAATSARCCGGTSGCSCPR